jgi:hypothetical protein
LLLAKAHEMDWSIVTALLSFRARHGFMASKEIEQSLASYERILPESAARILHFYVRNNRAALAAQLVSFA